MSRIWVIGAVLLVSACSDNGGQTGSQVEPVKGEQTGSQSESVKGGDHAWKTQTDQIDRARDVEKVLLDSHAQQQQAIDEQTR